MTAARRCSDRLRLPLLFLAAFVAVSLGLFGAGPASAATASAAQNRVGVSRTSAAVLVGPPTIITEGQRLGNSPVRPGIVVATGVAANTAEAAADAALAAGRTTGAAAELRVGGQVFTDVSTGGAPRVLNGSVQEALDAVPFPRPGWHGACAEMGCLSQALDAGVNPAGGSIRAVAIGTSNPGHGLPKVICTSCSAVLEVFGVGR